MFKIIGLIYYFLLIFTNLVVAQENISSFDDQNISVLNDELRQMRKDIRNSSNTSFSDINGIVGLDQGGTGTDLSTATVDSLLYINSLGTTSYLAPGTSGYVVTSQGAGLPPIYATPNHTTVFTSSGTFIPTTPIIFITMVGGGGSGGLDSTNGSGGGGAGASIVNAIYSVTPGFSYTVIIGAGGPGRGTSGDGTDGGDTSFDSVIIAKGGKKGIQLGTHGAGGAAPTISLNASTTTGGLKGYNNGVILAGGDGADGAVGNGGGGGGSIFSAGGNGGLTPTGGGADVSIANSGAGGGGGAGLSSSPHGGAGASGVVIISY